MANADDFTFIDSDGSQGSKPTPLFDDYHRLTSGKTLDLDAQIITSLRAKHPDLIITTVPAFNCNLLQFAAAGFAQAELDEDAEPVLRWRGFVGPSHRGGHGYVADNVFFARYNYSWNSENFIFYSILVGRSVLQYILKEPRGNETTKSNSAVVAKLLSTIGAWLIQEEPAIYIYDGYWTRSTKLWEEVKKAKWADVILDPKMKKAVTEVASKFFDSKEIYEEYGVPWKRGVIFHGPVGNGKTISLKALMHTLYDRKPPVVTLYVKSAPASYNIRSVFQMARSMTPCMLVMEDIDTIVTRATRSYFFNEVDGLENNDVDQLDPGLSKRPSRFDRKYLFPQPDKDERALYAHYWYNKLKGKKNIDFPEELCDDIAEITDDFSFAYMKEAFVATLLELARGGDDDDDDEEPEEWNAYTNSHIPRSEEDMVTELDEDESKFWEVFQAQVKILRAEMGSDNGADNTAATKHGEYEAFDGREDMVPLLATMGLQEAGGRQPGEAALPLATPGPAGALNGGGARREGNVDYCSLFGHVQSFNPSDW